MSESGVEELTKLVAEAVNASEKAKDGVKEDVESALSSLKDLKDFKVSSYFTALNLFELQHLN